MAERKSIEDRLNELKEKQAKLKAQEKILMQKQSQQERKQRTRRLIETGAAVESVLKKSLGEIDGIIQKEDLPAIIEFLQQQEDRGMFFSGTICKKRNERNDISKTETVEVLFEDEEDIKK